MLRVVKRWYSKRPVSVRAAVLTGVCTIIAAAIIASFSLLSKDQQQLRNATRTEWKLDITTEKVFVNPVLDISETGSLDTGGLSVNLFAVDNRYCLFTTERTSLSDYKYVFSGSGYPVFLITFVNDSDTQKVLGKIEVTNHGFQPMLTEDAAESLEPLISYDVFFDGSKMTMIQALLPPVRIPSGEAASFHVRLIIAPSFHTSGISNILEFRFYYRTRSE